MERIKPRPITPRRAFRVPVVPFKPVRFSMIMDGVRVDPIVEELGVDGARLLSAKEFDRFYEGQRIGPATVRLEDMGTLTAFAVVKWRCWPQIGVEFVDMPEGEREKLFRYLFKVHRQAIRYVRTKQASPTRPT